MSAGRQQSDACGAITWLFVPGDRPDRFDKAGASGAGAVICDLEDAVAPEAKSHARREVAGWLAGAGAAWVRINAVGTAWYDEDIAALTGSPGLQGVVVPKAESAIALRALSERLGDGGAVIALVETALGIHHAYDIAQCDVVDRLAFGSIDFAIDIDADESADSLLLARSTLVIASRVANKPAPIDGVTTDLHDAAVVQAAAQRACRAGFGGKLCVHPDQLVPVAAGFRPSEKDVRWAQDVVRQAQQSTVGVSAVGGVMIDKPVLERAQRILERAASGP